MSDDKEKAVVTKDQLKDVLRSLVDDAVAEKLAPLDEKVTNFGAMIMTRSSDEPREIKDKDRGIGMARIFRAMAAAKGDPEKAARWGKQAWDDKLGDEVTKALSAGDFTSGGFIVPESMRQEIIPLLRARNIVRAAGAPVLPMPFGTMTLPKTTGDVTASYIGENQNITKTEPTGGHIVLSAKKLAALTPISNDLLDFDVGSAADTWVRDLLVRHISGREDRAFLRDDGTSSTPKGLRNWALAASITATNVTSAANIEDDFTDLIQDLEGNNVSMDTAVWMMNPRSKNHLLNLRDGNGNLIFPEVRNANPTVYTRPMFVSNNIPVNLGGGSNETELYMVNMADTIIGEAGGMEITVDSSASYVENGSLVSAFSRDQTIIRAIMRHDFGVTYEEAIAVKTGITWGA